MTDDFVVTAAPAYRLLVGLSCLEAEPGLSEERALALLSCRLETELALIQYWRESVPEPGLNCDDRRLASEAAVRVERLAALRCRQRRGRVGWRRLFGTRDTRTEIVRAAAAVSSGRCR